MNEENSICIMSMYKISLFHTLYFSLLKSHLDRFDTTLMIIDCSRIFKARTSKLLQTNVCEFT